MVQKYKKVSGEFSVLFRVGLVLLTWGMGIAIPFIVGAQTAGQLGLSVTPQMFEIDVFPGEVFTEKIKVGNLSNVALPLNARLADFTAAEDSGEILFDESAQDPSISAKFWIKFETPNFILAPQENRELNFSITVPESAEIGGHYSVVLFEPQLPSYYFKEGQPRTIPVIGVLFLISVKTLSLEQEAPGNKIAVAEFSIPKEERLQILEKALGSIIEFIPKVSAHDLNIVEKTPSSFILRVKNNDIFHHKLAGKILIYSPFGKKIGEAEIKRTTILPGKVRQFPVAYIQENTPAKIKWLPASLSDFILKNTALGKYRAVLMLQEEKSNIEINSALNFWAFSWKIFLIIAFCLLIIILLRKRLWLAIKFLLTSPTTHN